MSIELTNAGIITAADALVTLANKAVIEAEAKVALAEKIREEFAADLRNAEALVIKTENNLSEAESAYAQAKANLAAFQTIKVETEEVRRYLASQQTTLSSAQDAFLKGLIETPEG